MASKKVNKHFTPKQKLEAVIDHMVLRRLVGDKKQPYRNVAELCRMRGISRSHLREWARLVRERGPEIFAHGSTFSQRKRAIERLGRLEPKHEMLEIESGLKELPSDGPVWGLDGPGPDSDE